MKRQTILLLFLIAASISLYAFSNSEKQSIKNPPVYKWWDFIGTSAGDQYDNNNYTLDLNNFPDCPPRAGTIFCEIYALTDPNSDPSDPKPDLSTISNQRMKF